MRIYENLSLIPLHGSPCWWWCVVCIEVLFNGRVWSKLNLLFHHFSKNDERLFIRQCLWHVNAKRMRKWEIAREERKLFETMCMNFILKFVSDDFSTIHRKVIAICYRLNVFSIHIWRKRLIYVDVQRQNKRG